MTKRVLLITMGETPQIVTETVYALLKKDRPWVPDRIILATTGSGKAIFENGLSVKRNGEPLDPPLPPLVGKNGQLEKLYIALGLIDMICDVEIVAPEGLDRAPLFDVRSKAEVDAFAEKVMGYVREVTREPDAELHLSIAGGRKTMGGIATQILSIFGRPQDSLSHCLVEPQSLEWDSTFWWPGSNPEIDTKDAEILLHESPYVRIRASISKTEALNNDRLSFAQIVEKANNGLSADKIEFDFDARVIRIGNQTVIPHTQLKISSALAVVLVATKLGWGIRKDDSKYSYRYLVRDTEEDFERILVVCYALLSNYQEWIETFYSKSKTIGDFNPGLEAFIDSLKEETVGIEGRKAKAMNGTSFNSGISSCRTWLNGELGPELSTRALLGSKLGIGTAFTADQISIILPPGLTLNIFDKDLCKP